MPEGEHVLAVRKCQFGDRKRSYRGLAKNTAQLTVLSALVNVWLAGEALWGCQIFCVRGGLRRSRFHPTAVAVLIVGILAHGG